MLDRKFISRFSPNRTNPLDLEKITIQVGRLLETSVEKLRESILTRNKHHLLFIGPRGCGKTHLITLIAHRLSGQEDLREKLLIAWLNEDETSTTFLELLIRIYRSLTHLYAADFPISELDAIYSYKPDEARRILSEILLNRIGKRRVVVLIENLDSLFADLSESEQQKWRGFIQNSSAFATAATAQRLFAGVSKRENPFFGFFSITHLKPLSVDEATELLQRIARLNSDSTLDAFLQTHRGRARVYAIHHLSGGNQRLYIALSDFINKDSLDGLVRPFEEMVDEQLTPYYQERLRWLPPLQRKIVEFLCQQSSPVSVKEIEKRLFSTNQTISGQLGELRERGYVETIKRGRESLNELKEPLMRLSMQVKEGHDHQPLQLIVDFLRVWYDREEIEKRLETNKMDGRVYLSAALAKMEPGKPSHRHEIIREIIDSLDPKSCDRQNLELMQVVAEDEGKPLHQGWNEGLEGIGQILSAQKQYGKSIQEISDLAIEAVFNEITSECLWRKRANELVEVYSKHNRLAFLGNALVRHLTVLQKNLLSSGGLDGWLSGWGAAAGNTPAMSLPLRLLAVGIKYLKSNLRDDGVLLELPSVERRILQQALKLN